MISLLDCAIDELIRLDVERPRTTVMLTSGLGDVAKRLVPGGLRMPYDRIVSMPISGVGGHRGELILGSDVAVSVGRAQLLQGTAPRDVAFSVHLASALSLRRVILTNAARGGGLTTSRSRARSTR